jgi:putative FmdB family regulatory protein
MPTYAYRCTSCDHQFDAVQKFSDAPIDVCPVCGEHTRRVFHPVGIVFKGSGWYVTDSRKSDSGKGDSAKSSDTAPATGETGPTEKAAPEKAAPAKPAAVAAAD